MINEQYEVAQYLEGKNINAMNAIGNDYINNRNNLALMAELEGMTLDQLGGWVNTYANTVINANAAVADSYDNAARHVSGLYRTMHEQSVTPLIPDSSGPAMIEAGEPSIPETALNIVKTAGQKFGQALSNAGQKAQEDGIITNLRGGAGDFVENTIKKILEPFANASDALKNTKYHKGGLVRGISPTANVSSQFLKYMNKLQSDEVPAILQAGEYVLTKQHQSDILNERANLINSVRNGGTTTLEIGDIVINQPVGSVESLSLAIVQKLPNQIMKDLYAK